MRSAEAIIELCEVIKKTAGSASAVTFKDFDPIEKPLEDGFWVLSTDGTKLYNVDQYGKCDCPAGTHRGKCRHAEKCVGHTPMGILLAQLPLSLSRALTLVSAEELERLDQEGIIKVDHGVVERL